MIPDLSKMIKTKRNPRRGFGQQTRSGIGLTAPLLGQSAGAAEAPFGDETGQGEQEDSGLMPEW